MDQIIVDTDILIDYFRTNKGELVNLLEKQLQGKLEIAISSVTVYELFSGKSSKESKPMILRLISKFKIIPMDEKITEFAGELNRDNNLSISSHDFFIAATAILCDSLLATKNKKHFSKIPGLKLILDKPE
ncbi:type II toxin-antitoxin system VapC family toxin [Candidatus Gottesmanbacteria bacterium]|nr:type II toxin-antitoxin system VapC family toxin [Candidatus Gottesmanbacteria bacterium]